jgi:hypothetical protein
MESGEWRVENGRSRGEMRDSRNEIREKRIGNRKLITDHSVFTVDLWK